MSRPTYHPYRKPTSPGHPTARTITPDTHHGEPTHSSLKRQPATPPAPLSDQPRAINGCAYGLAITLLPLALFWLGIAAWLAFGAGLP